MELLVAVNTQDDRFPAHGRHYLSPQLLLAANIFEFPHMVHFKVSPFLPTVFTFLGLKPLCDFGSGEGEVQAHRSPKFVGESEIALSSGDVCDTDDHHRARRRHSAAT